MSNPTPQKKLVERFAERFGVDPDKLLHTLKQTAFRQRGEKEVTNEQMMALLVVAEQYNLNPWTKEIFAFDDKNMGIIPVVSVDGWTRLINSHRDYDGLEFTYAEQVVTLPDGKPCPEWCEVSIYRKGIGRPIVIREYLDEVYVGKRNGYSGPWQTHTKRLLRHKTLIQGARVAFGFAGIYDEDEAYRIIDGEATRVAVTTTAGGANAGQLQAALQQRAQVIEHEPNPLSAAYAGKVATGMVIDDPINPHELDADRMRYATMQRTEPGPEGAPAEAVDDHTLDAARYLNTTPEGAAETHARQTDAQLVYASEGPAGLSAMIADATEQDAIDALVSTIATIPEDDIRKDLTRAVLARKAQLLNLSGD